MLIQWRLNEKAIPVRVLERRVLHCSRSCMKRPLLNGEGGEGCLAYPHRMYRSPARPQRVACCHSIHIGVHMILFGWLMVAFSMFANLQQCQCLFHQIFGAEPIHLRLQYPELRNWSLRPEWVQRIRIRDRLPFLCSVTWTSIGNRGSSLAIRTYPLLLDKTAGANKRPHWPQSIWQFELFFKQIKAGNWKCWGICGWWVHTSNDTVRAAELYAGTPVQIDPEDAKQGISLEQYRARSHPKLSPAVG